MNYDDFDVDRTLKKEFKCSPALNLIKGLNNRAIGYNEKAKEDLALFAEQELVRKETFSEMKCELPGLPRSSFLMVFSSDGSKIASTHGNHNIYVSDSKSGKNIKTLVGHPRTPWCIAFHPTSNQIVASGCLGGQVRIWDLSGGSEVWTTENQSVIASIAFHPNDRVLVIATFNEVYFWDWSKPVPFVQCSTNNPKEKVRYVAFDHLGHKLITGIANSPQTRWERVRAPVPVNSRICCTLPYRRRITPRLVHVPPRQWPPLNSDPPPSQNERETYSSIPERERRITTCYRNLVREYEQLVQRYLQLYRPRQMIDRGTDPMETNSSSTTSGTQTPDTSASSAEPSTSSPQPSTSRTRHDCQPEPTSGPSTSQNLISPSRIFSVLKKSPGLIRGTQTTESRKHKVDRDVGESGHEKKVKRQRHRDSPSTSSEPSTPFSSETTPNTQLSDMGTQTQSPRRVLVINTSTMRTPEPSTSFSQPSTSGSRMSLRSAAEARRNSNMSRPSTSNNVSDTDSLASNVDELLSNIRRTAEEEVRNRILPIIRSVPENDRPELIRLFENNREHYRMRLRQMCCMSCKKPKRWPRPPTNTSSENNSSSDDDTSNRSSRHSTTTSPQQPTAPQESPNPATTSRRTTTRNYNTELEQLVTSLLTEIENNETDSTNNRPTSDNRSRNLIVTTASTTQTSTDSLMNRSNASRVSFSNTSNITNTSSQHTPSSLENSLFSSALPNGPPARSSATTNSSSSSSNSPQNFEFLSLFESLDSYTQSLRDTLDPATSTPTTTSATSDSTTAVTTTTASTMSTNTRTTNSAVYTSNTFRRFFSNRASAFMPTRVNYTRTPSRLRRCRHILNRGNQGSNARGSFGLDELTNFSERANSEDDPPNVSSLTNSSSPTSEARPISPENFGIGNLSSNMAHDLSNSNLQSDRFMSPENFGIGNLVQDLESSLNDVRNIRENSRPGEGSDMLSSFSERLENIWNRSDTILRNLRSSLLQLQTSRSSGDWIFNDPSFYVRDQRNDTSLDGDLPNVGDNLNSRMFNAVASDHTYPRNPDSSQQSPGGSEQMSSPLMTSLHITITHIQRQARLLRQQVESIERIDRAMLELSQIQLLRQLVIELIRHMRLTNSSTSESRNTTGMSSVRQMMAGTRISDSSPYDSPAEETTTPSAPPTNTPTTEPSTSTAPPNPEPTTSSNTSPESTPTQSARTRGSSRKTYPPCRLLRLQRSWRRPSLVHFLSRRYMNRGDRGSRQNPQPRTTARMADILSPYRQQSFTGCSSINSSTLSLMTRRLEQLLTDQMRVFSRPNETPPTNNRTGPSIDLGEHILSLRLHGCVLRMNRLLANQANPPATLQSDPSATVSQDGVSRYGARHTLSLIVDGMTRHMEELGNSNSSQTLRLEIHGLLAMSLLLTESLLLQVVDSIPPPTGMNLDTERESLTSRIRGFEEMCAQMLHSRSHPLTRSLRLMRLTMIHAYRALRQTYRARRNAMLRRRRMDRRQLIGAINSCLGTINRVSTLRRPNSNTTDSNNFIHEWYSTITDYINRYSNSNEPDNSNSQSQQPEQPQQQTQPTGTARSRNYFDRPENTSSNNSDNDDESDWLINSGNSSSQPAPNPYRSNVVPVTVATTEPSSSRTWNVPSVHVNDIPVSDPSSYQQRIISQRQRFADRVSELRQNPSIGLLRPRFLHPLYASVNPFDADLDDPQREPVYENDMVTTATPNHRLQAWDISDWSVPAISNSMKNVIVGECKIHNDASVDIANDGTLLVTLLPSGGYLNVTNRLGIYSLRWETLGQCLYTTSFEQNAISVALSPLSRHLLVGLTSRRVSIVSNDRWVMARIFKIEQKDVPGDRLPMVRELEQTRDSRINCIRWLPCSGQGIIYGTNTGQLIVLT